VFTTPGIRALRKGRFSRPGHIYFVTTVSRRREPVFMEWEVAAATCRALNNPIVWRRSFLLCWVLMPDHWHGILQLGERDELPTVMNRAKSAMAKACNGACARAGRVWDRGFHDRALRREEDLVKLARYVVANPVRAGLVRSVRDYPFWNAVWI